MNAKNISTTRSVYECPCGKFHATFNTAKACLSCVQYLETRMIPRWGKEARIIKRT